MSVKEFKDEVKKISWLRVLEWMKAVKESNFSLKHSYQYGKYSLQKKKQKQKQKWSMLTYIIS